MEVIKNEFDEFIEWKYMKEQKSEIHEGSKSSIV
jgi:hypothetical protein